jgi:hypothetical protein
VGCVTDRASEVCCVSTDFGHSYDCCWHDRDLWTEMAARTLITFIIDLPIYILDCP